MVPSWYRYGVVCFACLLLAVFPFFVTAAQVYASSSGSSLLFGTNLFLNDASDQFLTSQATRDTLLAMHVQLIRMPIRSTGGPSSWEVQAMQDIHDMGVTPMIILKYTQPDPLGAAQQVLTQAVSIFGNETVYAEFGNERDLAGVTAAQYTTAWNTYFPTLHSQFPTVKFGGPVNYQTNPSYISYFVHNALPKPDFISWHEYTCSSSDSAATCITNISNWAAHITNTKAAIEGNGDAVPPIFISEWNYDPNPPSPDSRVTPAFQQQFVQTALQELYNDGVFGAAQYLAANGNQYYNLVDATGNPTPAGTTFGQMFSQLFPSPTPSPLAANASTSSTTASSSVSGAGANPNCIGGWAYCVDSGPHYAGQLHTIIGSRDAWKAKTLIMNTATNDDVHVVISALPPEDLTSQKIPIPWTEGFNVVSNIYDFQALSAFNGYPILSFTNPVTIILPYTDTYLTNVNLKGLHIIAYNPTRKRWTTLVTPVVINTQEGTVATTVKSFSLFAVSSSF